MDVAAAVKERILPNKKYPHNLDIKDTIFFKVKHLDFQTELNMVRPFVYAHKSPNQSYTNYNQALAHPLSANFLESVTFIDYWYKHWTASAKPQFAVYKAEITPTNTMVAIFLYQII